jgi:hypothetical protein
VSRSGTASTSQFPHPHTRRSECILTASCTFIARRYNSVKSAHNASTKLNRDPRLRKWLGLPLKHVVRLQQIGPFQSRQKVHRDWNYYTCLIGGDALTIGCSTHRAQIDREEQRCRGKRVECFARCGRSHTCYLHSTGHIKSNYLQDVTVLSSARLQ